MSSESFEFVSFMKPGVQITSTGLFRENIKQFLKVCAKPQKQNVGGISRWYTLLRHPGGSALIPLYTIKEDVESSPRPSCDHCRCTGWRDNLVSVCKYHFIIPYPRRWYDDPHKEEVNIFDLETHFLHGLIHCNGFGHLLCIKGIKGGSFTSGGEMMDLWDRICTALETRQVSFKDLTKKISIDLRLFHGIVYGKPWFGKWGYKFFQGSYNVQEDDYDDMIELLSKLSLDKVIQDIGDGNQDQGILLEAKVDEYKEMAKMSTSTDLVTLKDLLKFMLTVIDPKETTMATSDPFSEKIKSEVCNDLVYLHKDCLLNYPEILLDSKPVAKAIQVILDRKHFVQKWPFNVDAHHLGFICDVKLPPVFHAEEKKTHGELVMVPLGSTYLDLKKVAQVALSSTYCILKNFKVTNLLDMEEKDEDTMNGSYERVHYICLSGNGIDPNCKLSYEGGNVDERWTIDCSCGTRVVDGEKMWQCRYCNVWKHTRCNDILDSQSLPLFLKCRNCRQNPRRCTQKRKSDDTPDYASKKGKLMVGGSIVTEKVVQPQNTELGGILGELSLSESEEESSVELLFGESSEEEEILQKYIPRRSEEY